MNDNLFAVINIGASAFRMVIIEFKDGVGNEIDFLIKPLRLGVDTFTKGYIMLENIKQAADILSQFKIKLDEYKITNYKALCTSGVRDAKNRYFFLDYVRNHSGVNVEILEPSQEVYIKYVGVRNDVPNFCKLEEDGVLFANIASGNVTISITKADKVLLSGSLPYGSLRLKQMFLNVPSIKRYKAFDQYIKNMISSISSSINIRNNIKYFIGGGSSINLMIRIFKPAENKISKLELITLYSKIRSYSTNEIKDELQLRDDEANVLVSTLSIYIQLLELISADEFIFSRASFPNVLARFYSNHITDKTFYKRIQATIISTIKRYNVDIKHTKTVTRNAMKIFDSLSELHSLSDNDKKLLEVAALMHEVGAFISSDTVHINSFAIIKSLTIPGVSAATLEKVAAIVYQTFKASSDRDLNTLLNLDIDTVFKITKLSSILGIAKSLDSSRSGIITDIAVDINENLIMIDLFSSREPFVEILEFSLKKELFLNSFGIPIDIRVRVSYE